MKAAFRSLFNRDLGRDTDISRNKDRSRQLDLNREIDRSRETDCAQFAIMGAFGELERGDSSLVLYVRSAGT